MAEVARLLNWTAVGLSAAAPPEASFKALVDAHEWWSGAAAISKSVFGRIAVPIVACAFRAASYAATG